MFYRSSNGFISPMSGNSPSEIEHLALGVLIKMVSDTTWPQCRIERVSIVMNSKHLQSIIIFMTYCLNTHYYSSGLIYDLSKPADVKTFGCLIFLVAADEKMGCVSPEWFQVVSCLFCHSVFFFFLSLVSDLETFKLDTFLRCFSWCE